MDDAENTAKIAKDSGDRLREYIVGENSRKILTGKNLVSAKDIKDNGGIFLLDLDGPTLPEFSKMLAIWLLADISNTISNGDTTKKSLLVMDELSFYYNEIVNALYATARSKKMQIVSATQSFTDLDRLDPTYTNSLLSNSQQYLFMKLGTKDDIERACNEISTSVSTEITHRINGIDYDLTGSSKAIHKFNVHPEVFNSLTDLEAIYVRKNHGGKTVYNKVKWDYFTEDLITKETDIQPQQFQNRLLRKRGIYD